MENKTCIIDINDPKARVKITMSRIENDIKIKNLARSNQILSEINKRSKSQEKTL